VNLRGGVHFKNDFPLAIRPVKRVGGGQRQSVLAEKSIFPQGTPPKIEQQISVIGRSKIRFCGILRNSVGGGGSVIDTQGVNLVHFWGPFFELKKFNMIQKPLKSC